MPAETLFELAEKRPRQAAEIPLLAIAVFLVIADAVRKDVIRPQLHDAKAMLFHERTALTPGIDVRDRAAGLRLGMLGNQLRSLPHLPFSRAEKQPKHLPGVAVIHHELEHAA